MSLVRQWLECGTLSWSHSMGLSYLSCDMHNFWEVRGRPTTRAKDNAPAEEQQPDPVNDKTCSCKGQVELGNTWCTNKLSITDFAQDGILLEVGMECCIGLFDAYSPIPPTTGPGGIYTWLHWRQSRTPDSLTLVSVTTKQILLQWACNRHLSMVELPIATRQTGKTEPGDLLHLRQGLHLTTVEWKDFLPGSSLSHLDYGSRNNDLSLVSGICIVAILSQWFSCLAQFHLHGRGWTNFSPLFNDWDDTGPPPTSTSRLGITWDNFEWDLL